VDPLYARCVVRAAQLLGGYDELGAHLGIATPRLEAWSRGEAVPPTTVFLQIVDIILDAGVPPGGASSFVRRAR